MHAELSGAALRNTTLRRAR
ncbi:hypothetical protein [Alishewanella tabrizica]